jgi:basic amino acid/polyamine antiporter, APA family
LSLRRILGLPSLVFYGVGIILGAGIYSVVGAAAGRAGDSLWLSFVVAALAALLTALSYAELSSLDPSAAAEFAYLRRAFPRWPQAGSVVGLLVAFSGAATVATVATAFAGYLRDLVDGLAAAAIAWTLIALAAALNVVGVRQAGWVNVVFTLVEAAGLVVFVYLGSRTDGFGDALAATPQAGVAAGAALVFFSFLGFENIVNLAEEAKEPERDVPRAIFVSLAIVSLIYVLVALAAVALVPAAELGASDAPLADAARSSAPRLAGALGGVALFATANTALVSMLVASRVVFGMARDGALPRAFSAVLAGRKTPWRAVLAVAAVASALIPVGAVGLLASLSSFAALFAFAGVNVALIVLRYREPRAVRRFRVPLAIGRLPILPALAGATALALLTQVERNALLTGVAVLVVLGGVAWRFSGGRPRRG